MHTINKYSIDKCMNEGERINTTFPRLRAPVQAMLLPARMKENKPGRYAAKRFEVSLTHLRYNTMLSSHDT